VQSWKAREPFRVSPPAMMGVIWLAEMLRLPAPQHQLSSARRRAAGAGRPSWITAGPGPALLPTLPCARTDLEVCASRKRFVLLAQIPLSLYALMGKSPSCVRYVPWKSCSKRRSASAKSMWDLLREICSSRAIDLSKMPCLFFIGRHTKMFVVFWDYAPWTKIVISYHKPGPIKFLIIAL
jgi:hypothetical protein